MIAIPTPGFAVLYGDGSKRAFRFPPMVRITDPNKVACWVNGVRLHTRDIAVTKEGVTVSTPPRYCDQVVLFYEKWQE